MEKRIDECGDRLREKNSEEEGNHFVEQSSHGTGQINFMSVCSVIFQANRGFLLLRVGVGNSKFHTANPSRRNIGLFSNHTEKAR